MTNDPFKLIGRVLNGKYKLIEYANSGGMGIVYRALSLETDDIVAVKILIPDVVLRNPVIAALFEQEVLNAQSLNHPHIVRISDSARDDGGGGDVELSYMVMEWVEGSSLKDVITQRTLSIAECTGIFEQICNAINYAHEKKIIHLDLKPANILRLESAKPDFVKVIDFGFSRMLTTESGIYLSWYRGTPQYSSPEHLQGKKVTHRSDIYSLGVILYEMVTGTFPFGQSYVNAQRNPKLELPEFPSLPDHLNLPPAIDRVIKKAINQDPNLRQQSARQLFDEFNAAMPGKRTQEDLRLDAINEQDAFASAHATGDGRLAASLKHRPVEATVGMLTPEHIVTIGLVNKSSWDLSNYRVEIQVSAQFVKEGTPYNTEVQERRNERYRYFRKESKKDQAILKPGDRDESFFELALIIPPESTAMNDERQRIAVQVFADDDMTQTIITTVGKLLRSLPASSG